VEFLEVANGFAAETLKGPLIFLIALNL